jgi:predicted acetyltransferase
MAVLSSDPGRMTSLEITVAPPAERQLIANLFQLYTHDFSEFWAGRPEGELESDGRFGGYPYLEDYWREPGRVPLVFRVGGHPAGFALLNTISHSGLPVDRNMAEFFIVRKHRRGGTGTAAARGLFALYPGVWEAAVARSNVGALAFWRRAIGDCPGASEVEERDFTTDHWNGPILRFRMTEGR